MVTKDSLRSQFRACIPSPELQLRLSQKLCEHLSHNPNLVNAKNIGVFAARKNEPALFDLLSFFPKKLSFPKVYGKSLIFSPLFKLTDLVPGYREILEPKDSGQVTQFLPGDCILVPGICIDIWGARLGSGLGYYDRFLSVLPPEVFKIGVIWETQLSSVRLPQEPHDIRMDLICTEIGTIKAKI